MFWKAFGKSATSESILRLETPLWRDMSNYIMGLLKNRTSFLLLSYYYWRLGVRIHIVFYHLPDISTYCTHDDVGIRPFRVA